MNTTIIGLIALVTFAWTLFLQRIDSPDAVAEATQLKNERPIKYEQKVLGATAIAKQLNIHRDSVYRLLKEAAS